MPPPKLKIHHVNVCTHDAASLRDWYRDVLGLAHDTSVTRHRIVEESALYKGGVEVVTDDAVQVHIAETDPNLAARAGKSVNPLLHGHIAYRTNDLDGFKRHLEEQGIPYADYGHVFSTVWRQIFFHDPTGQVIEVQETDDAEF